MDGCRNLCLNCTTTSCLIIITGKYLLMEKLTLNETLKVQRRYMQLPDKDGMITLTPVKYMTKNDAGMLCFAADPSPFQMLKSRDWNIEYKVDRIELRGSIFAYHIMLDTCNVHLYQSGRLTTMANNGNVFQYYHENNYAYPIYFNKGHWANGKTPFELGIAVPDKQPLRDALMRLHDNNITLVQDYFFDKELLNIDLTKLSTYEQELTEIKKQLADKR
jgi:hypothetical protein